MNLHCPKCGKKIAKPAIEGGLLIKARYVRVATNGIIHVACRECGEEMPSARAVDPHLHAPDR